MSRFMEIIVSPQGETTLQTKGFQGPECLEASRFLERALGIGVQERKTAEFFAQASQQQTQQQ
ncbi:MAG: DUF2997 domain-containing protein [Gemmataceae bacterium]